jgi:hypothetical protein
MPSLPQLEMTTFGPCPIKTSTTPWAMRQVHGESSDKAGSICTHRRLQAKVPRGLLNRLQDAGGQVFASLRGALGHEISQLLWLFRCLPLSASPLAVVLSGSLLLQCHCSSRHVPRPHRLARSYGTGTPRRSDRRLQSHSRMRHKHGAAPLNTIGARPWEQDPATVRGPSA